MIAAAQRVALPQQHKASRTTSCSVRAHASSGHKPVTAGRQQQQTGALLQRAGAAVLAGALSASLMFPGAAAARLDPVNRPDLLPKEFSTVIDVAGFLTPSEEARLATQVAALERDTGFKLRVLAQSYPETPGLAVREYWGVDDATIVFVADPTFQNLVNLNIGEGIDLEVPQSFWSRLAGRYGNKFYWQEKGEAAAINNTVGAIDACLREPQGRNKCSSVQAEFDAF